MKPAWLVAALLAAAFSSVPARAVVLREVGFDQLAQEANAVVHGRIVGKRCAWNQEHTLIFTHYVLEVQRAMKGFPGGRVEFNEIGGQVDGVAQLVQGTPEYELDEEAVVFLHAEKGRVMTLRWFQGKFPVVPRGLGGRDVVVPDGGRRVALDEFARRVTDAIARSAGHAP